MMYAVIRARGEALHFIAEMSPYNLQTLRDYVRAIARDRGSAELRISFDASDYEGKTVAIDRSFVTERVGEVAADEDLSNFSL